MTARTRVVRGQFGVRTNTRLAILVYSTVLGGCSSFVVGQPQGLDLITNSMEASAESVFVDTLIPQNPNLFYNVNRVFEGFASIEFAWYFPNYRLPRPNSQLPSDPWPDPNGFAPQQYLDYARVNRDTSQFGAFFVDHMATNPQAGTCAGFTGGLTPLPDPHTTPNSDFAAQNSRVSYVFLNDVDAVSIACGVTRENVLISVTTHELGHQRAGLTDADSFPQYHRGHVPQGRYDVMAYRSIQDLGRFNIPVFDFIDTIPHPNDTTSCQGNLYASRSFRF